MSGRVRRAHTAAAPALWPPHLSRLHGVQLLHSSLDGRVRPGGIHRSQRCALHQWVRVGRPAAGVGRLPILLLVIRWRCIGFLALQEWSGGVGAGTEQGWRSCYDVGAWQACWICWEDGQAGNNGGVHQRSSGGGGMEGRRPGGAGWRACSPAPRLSAGRGCSAGLSEELGGLSEGTWGAAPGSATAAMLARCFLGLSSFAARQAAWVPGRRY